MTAVLATTPRDGRRSDLIRVIFADDSATTRTLVRHVLTSNPDLSVIAEAADGAEAIAMVETHRPDCVLLDIQMPGVGGFEALGELQRRCPTVPVIMLSGFSDESVTDRARAAGAAAVVDKSTDLMKLAEVIRRVSMGAATDPVDAPESPPEVASDRALTDKSLNRPVPSLVPPIEDSVADLRRLEYAVSHDFAEPLRNMRGFATLLATQYSKSLDGPGLLFLHHIATAADRMQSMIDDLLLYSRAGRQPARADVVDTNVVAAAVVASLDARIVERRATVTVGDLPTVVGDRQLLATVLKQLVLNGLIFNTSPTPTIQIDGSTGESATITVTDNGIGVDAAQHELVFELFRRLNTSDEYPGTGSGLALCRRMVVLQGGAIDIRTSSRDGTTFRVVLPRPADTVGVAS